jgi:hypothetical protein
MKKGTTYYLSSLESVRFEAVRKCELVKQMAFDTGKQCALVRLSPAVIGQPWGLSSDIEFFVLANRHKGEKLFPISEFPCFVHIARLHSDASIEREVIRASDLENVAWGELYRSRSDAENHVFGTSSQAN